MNEKEKGCGTTDDFSEAKKTVSVAIVGCGKKVLTVSQAQLSIRMALGDEKISRVEVLSDDAQDILARVKKMPRGSLAVFAAELINLSRKEVQELARILEEEYGIVPAAAQPMVFEDRPLPVVQEIFIPKHCGKAKKDYYVPKKIGKVNTKPKK